MPIYEYVCDDCRTKFEKLVRREAADAIVCPACGKDRVTQQISTFLSPVPGKVKEPARQHSEYPYGALGNHHD